MYGALRKSGVSNHILMLCSYRPSGTIVVLYGKTANSELRRNPHVSDIPASFVVPPLYLVNPYLHQLSNLGVAFGPLD